MATTARIAELLGAKVIGQTPEVGGGAFGAARLGELFVRMTQRHRRNCVSVIPLTEAVEAKLARLADKATASGHPITPSELGARLLAEALAAYPDE